MCVSEEIVLTSLACGSRAKSVCAKLIESRTKQGLSTKGKEGNKLFSRQWSRQSMGVHGIEIQGTETVGLNWFPLCFWRA